MNRPSITVDRAVIAEVIRLAAMEPPGVLRLGRTGPRLRAWLAGSPISIRIGEGSVDVRVVLVARPGTDLAAVCRDVRSAVAAAVERLVGLRAGGVTVIVDGVGA